MRTILWIFVVLVCLVPVTFIGISYWRAPSRDDVQAQRDYNLAWKNYADAKQTDLTVLQGDNENEEFVRILSDYLNKSLALNNRLAQVKNNMVIMLQPQTLANPAMIYEMLEKQITYQKEVQSITDDYETATAELVSKTEALDKKKLKIDTVSFVQGINENKPTDEKELALYMSLANNVKALLEFVNTRNGYYQMGTDKYLHFTRPEDQAYYVKVVTLLLNNFKQVEDLREQNNKNVKKFVSEMPEI